MKLFEVSPNLTLLHGSEKPLPLNKPLAALPVKPTAYRAHSLMTALLEEFKPSNQPSRLRCWFMSDSLLQLKMSTASTKYIYVVQPNTPVFVHYYGWVALAENYIRSEAVNEWISHDKDKSLAEYEQEVYAVANKMLPVQEMCMKYWNGIVLDEQTKNQAPVPAVMRGINIIEYTTENITVVSKFKKS